MRKLSAFIHISLDGCYADPDGDMRWAHEGTDNPQWNRFVAGNTKGSGALAFGRVTYEMMARYWPSAMARAQNGGVARRMNAAPKYVFSRKMKKADWSNTRIVKNLVAGVKTLKAQKGPDIVILGSGSIVAQLIAAGLLDALQVIVNPLVLGGGKMLFAGVGKEVALTLTNARAFGNGKVLMDYQLPQTNKQN